MKHGRKEMREVEVSDSDWCKQRIAAPRPPYDTDDVEVRMSVSHHVTVGRRHGTVYPEGGCETVVEIDMCPRCFSERLLPWLKKQGCDVREREVGW